MNKALVCIVIYFTYTSVNYSMSLDKKYVEKVIGCPILDEKKCSYSKHNTFCKEEKVVFEGKYARVDKVCEEVNEGIIYLIDTGIDNQLKVAFSKNLGKLT